MTALRALLVDDERLARRQLRGQLGRCPEIEVVAEAEAVARALEEVDRWRPDVVFLDIQMPGGNGFDFLARAPGRFKVIFVTAFDEFAVGAFDANALDYLLKPVRFERLRKAVDRLVTPVPLSEAVRPMKLSEYLFVSSGSRARFLKLDQITHISADGAYSHVFTADGDRWMLARPMRHWQERLPSPPFARIHRSCIVNLEHAQSVEPAGGAAYRVLLRGAPSPLSLSRRFARLLRARLSG